MPQCLEISLKKNLLWIFTRFWAQKFDKKSLLAFFNDFFERRHWHSARPNNDKEMWEEILNLLGALENRSGCKQKLQISHVQDQISMLFLLYSASSSTQRSSFKKCQQDAGGGGSGGSHSTILCTPLKSNNATAWQKSALISSFFFVTCSTDCFVYKIYWSLSFFFCCPHFFNAWHFFLLSSFMFR